MAIPPNPSAPPLSAAEVLRLLAQMPDDLETGERWRAFAPSVWPSLFQLLEVAADLPRLADNQTLAHLPEEVWPDLARVGADWLRLQQLVDDPVIPPGAETAVVHGAGSRLAAREELEGSHCVTIDDFFTPEQRSDLDRQIAHLADTRAGFWGQLEPADAPELFDLVQRGLAGESFAGLTGFDLDRDTFTLTLSLQSLDPAGIGWHRDLYWPKEWVGEDVFAVLYGLGDDSPEKGGAFLYYVPWINEIRAIYRRRHQATILLNHHTTEGRILHAVSRYLGDDTSRHLIILQCLRRRR